MASQSRIVEADFNYTSIWTTLCALERSGSGQWTVGSFRRPLCPTLIHRHTRPGENLRPLGEDF